MTDDESLYNDNPEYQVHPDYLLHPDYSELGMGRHAAGSGLFLASGVGIARWHFAPYKSVLSPQNGMNIYRGCTHGCIYCDSRSVCYQMKHEFEDIEVKRDAPLILDEQLRRRREPCMIITGSMSDPYIPLEAELKYTRSCLLLIERHGFGVAVQTKSALVLRDTDILRRINQKTRAVVQMTLTTADEKLCRIIEPHVSTTAERFHALTVMRDNGIPTAVWISPLLPFINDSEENLRGVLDYCVRARVSHIVAFGPGLTLRDGDREYFYQSLDKHFPGMKARYVRAYGNAYELVSPNADRLNKILRETCDKHGIVLGHEQLFSWLAQFPNQAAPLSLF